MRIRDMNRLLALALLALATSVASAQTQQQKYGAGQSRAAVARRFNPSLPKPADGPLVNLTVSGASYPHMSKAAYTDLRNASMTMMQKYPPDQHVYIGLGRDPAPFIAFLQEIGADAMSFPASGGSFAQSPELDRHFEKLIPASVRNGQKTIVLIDQTRSGKTHAQIMPLLKSYLARTGSSAQVVGVVYNSASTVSRNNANLNLDVINTTPFPEVFKFFYSPYEGVVSPFERHVPGTNTVEQLQWRPQYDQFRTAIGQRVETDPDLDQFLAKFNAPPPPPPPPPQPAPQPAPQQQAPPPGKPTRFQAWGVTRTFNQAMTPLSTASTLSLKRKKQSYSFLDQTEYDSLRWGTQELLRRHPPSKGRYYLGVGRSSSPIVAYLENLGSNVGYLPADGLKNDTVTPALEASFQQYFAQFIPPAVLQRGETVTLFHQSDTGKTLTTLKPMLERYIAAQGSTSKVEAVAFSSRATVQGVSRIDTRAHQALQSLNGDAFKAVAVQTYHHVGTDNIADLKLRKDYRQFKTALLERMRRDQALDQFLSQPE
jgi:hypothetical protein